ncbi:hypothetical protein GCM10022287_21160 [Gryllotalpicola koreensis]|uniref:MerR family transcriptional regulator n=1 Tax=Gryllotalpicola koreensis TaxID=993086 RepID=A0ABP8A1C4_9MICO
MLSVPAFEERFGPMDVHAGHFRRYSPEDLDQRILAAGLRTDTIRAYGWPLSYALEAVRNRIDAKKLAAARRRGTSAAELTAASGRTFQSPALRGVVIAVAAATLPFRYAQRRPTPGIGLVAVATRPE